MPTDRKEKTKAMLQNMWSNFGVSSPNCLTEKIWIYSVFSKLIVKGSVRTTTVSCKSAHSKPGIRDVVLLNVLCSQNLKYSEWREIEKKRLKLRWKCVIPVLYLSIFFSSYIVPLIHYVLDRRICHWVLQAIFTVNTRVMKTALRGPQL